jgi:hypothetical protein
MASRWGKIASAFISLALANVAEDLNHYRDIDFGSHD